MNREIISYVLNEKTPLPQMGLDVLIQEGLADKEGINEKGLLYRKMLLETPYPVVKKLLVDPRTLEK